MGIEVENGSFGFFVRPGEVADLVFGLGDDVGEGFAETRMQGRKAGCCGVREDEREDMLGVGCRVG